MPRLLIRRVDEKEKKRNSARTQALCRHPREGKGGKRTSFFFERRGKGRKSWSSVPSRKLGRKGNTSIHSLAHRHQGKKERRPCCIFADSLEGGGKRKRKICAIPIIGSSVSPKGGRRSDRRMRGGWKEREKSKGKPHSRPFVYAGERKGKKEGLASPSILVA